MSDTLIIIALIIAGWWSGLIPALVLALGGLFAVIGITILSVFEKIAHAKWFAPIRWQWLKLTGIEDRRVKAIMRSRPGTPEQKALYEAGLRERRKRNIKRESR